jgi:hypothetical protein
MKPFMTAVLGKYYCKKAYALRVVVKRVTGSECYWSRRKEWLD